MIYEPREDTYLLKNTIEGLELKDKQVLEVGTGSGLIAEKMSEMGADVTASDINEEALEDLSGDITAIKSDLFENITGSFDLIVFNPPYLPGEEKESELESSETWLGGEKGIEVTEKFLQDCKSHLNKGGEALVVLSSLASIDDLMEKYGLEVVDTESLWFETLYVARYTVE